jgi:dolichol-phosphate mannosyltransferase
MAVRRLVWIIAIGTAARAAVAARFPIHPDEAYYWLWAHHPALGYLDQPPMVAYLILLATRLGDAVIWIRLPSLLLGAATSYALFLLGREMFDDRAGLVAAALFQIVPILMFGGIMAVPDAPMYLAWVLALRFVWQALHERPQRWRAAGLAMGFGLLSKFYMAWLALGMLLYVVLDARSWLRRAQPYQGAIIALALVLPVAYWNLHHHWANVRFLLDDRPRPRQGLAGFETFWLTLPYVAFLTPAFVWAFWTTLRRAQDERFRYLCWTSLPAVVFPILVAAAGVARGHWWGPVYLQLAVVVGALWNRAVAAMAAGNALVVGCAMALAVAGLSSVPPLSFLSYLYGWNTVAQRVEQQMRQLDAATIVVTDRYSIAAALSYYGNLRYPVLLAGATDPASVWPRFKDYRGANGVGVAYSAFPWARCFRRSEDAAPMPVHPYQQVRVVKLYGLFADCPRGPRPTSTTHARVGAAAR